MLVMRYGVFLGGKCLKFINFIVKGVFMKFIDFINRVKKVEFVDIVRLVKLIECIIFKYVWFIDKCYLVKIGSKL